MQHLRTTLSSWQDNTSLLEIAQFVVRENNSRHLSSFTEKEVNEDIKSVLEEEEYLYDNKSRIYIARDAFGNIIGCIRSFHWDKHKILPIEKIYGINPLNAIHQESKYSFWHIGRFAVAKDSGISTLTLFKRLMALAVKPIVEDKYSYMIAEIDSKLLKVMKVLGFGTRQIGKSIDYLRPFQYAPVKEVLWVSFLNMVNFARLHDYTFV